MEIKIEIPDYELEKIVSKNSKPSSHTVRCKGPNLDKEEVEALIILKKGTIQDEIAEIECPRYYTLYNKELAEKWRGPKLMGLIQKCIDPSEIINNGISRKGSVSKKNYKEYLKCPNCVYNQTNKFA